LRALVGRPVPKKLHAALLLWLLYAESFAEFVDALTLGLLMFPFIHLPVNSSATTVTDPNVGQWYPVRFSEGTVMQVRYGGQLSSTAFLPG